MIYIRNKEGMRELLAQFYSRTMTIGKILEKLFVHVDHNKDFDAFVSSKNLMASGILLTAQRTHLSPNPFMPASIAAVVGIFSVSKQFRPRILGTQIALYT